jgi:hypothetical protein
MWQGMLMVELTEPKLTAIEQSSAASTIRFEAAASPVVKLITEPPPRACRE